MPGLNQEVFDKVAHHLLTQGKKAMYAGQCRYRTGDGLKCAVGCLIDDADYSAIDMEGKGVISLLHDPRVSFANSLLLEDVKWACSINSGASSYTLLKELQLTHDGKPVYEWPSALQKIAEKYKLSNAVLEGFKK